MHHFFVSPEQIRGEEIVITGPDVNHIKNVLRMKAGDELRICTGTDNLDYRCRIRSFSENEVVTEILWKEETDAELPSKLVLFQALPKTDKMELIIQKAVELGVSKIVPVRCARCVVKLIDTKSEAKVKRWNLISLSAAKQAKRMAVPQVERVVSFDEALKMASDLTHILIPYEKAEGIEETRRIVGGIQKGESVGIFIGPEGGFEESEVEKALSCGAKSITLGRRILRTETAGMTMLSILMFHLEK